MKNYFVALLLCTALAVAQNPDILTNETVIKMVLSGVPAGTIIRAITSSDRVAFSFLPGDLDLMQRTHIPDDVFKAMAAKSAGRPVPGAGTASSRDNRGTNPARSGEQTAGAYRIPDPASAQGSDADPERQTYNRN